MVNADLSQFQRPDRDQRQDDPDDPEPDDDLGLGPAHLLEVVMDRRHPEDPFPRQLVRSHLEHDRDRLGHENSADDDQDQLVLGDDGERPQGAAQRARIFRR